MLPANEMIKISKRYEEQKNKKKLIELKKQIVIMGNE